MGKVNYKPPSENFKKFNVDKPESSLRASLGREQDIREILYLSIENLVPYKKQARRVFDEKELSELGETIKNHGINSPLLVVSSDETPGKFEVVSGERRLRAAELVNLEKLPCIILKDLEKAEEISLIENIQRSDLHPVELGEALKSLLADKKWGSASVLAEKLGKSVSVITESAKLAGLPEEIKVHLLERNIRSRDTLRKIAACKTLEEMKDLLGINNNATPQKRSILRISLEGEGLIVQGSSLNKLNKKEREKLKNFLRELLKKLDSIET